MYKYSLSEIPYDDIDIEIQTLCRYINEIEGVETEESCFGHNEKPCRIWLKAENTEVLNQFLFNFFDCDPLWHIELDTGDVNRDWNDIHLLLHSGDIKDFPTVNLMVDNLTNRFKEGINALKENKNGNDRN